MDRLTRRGAIKASAALGAGLVLGARAGSARSRTRVVVVGAGLAGLAAAHELDRAGFEVVVLEARRRVGGRVRTVRRPFAGGQHAEAGGEFVDTTHRILRGYARRFHLPLEDVRKGGGDLEPGIYLGGKLRRRRQVETDRVERELERFDRAVERLAAPLDPRDPLARGAHLDARSAADLIANLRLDPTARLLVEQDLRDEHTIEPDQLSLLFLAQQYALTEELPDSGVEAFRIRGGNDRLARALALGLARTPHRGAAVTAIRRSSGGVVVEANGDRVSADWCVVSAPLPALRQVDFQPALPGALGAAVRELQYGVATKTFLQYRRRVWRDRGFDGDTLSDLPLGSTWEATDRQRGRRGVLLAYTAGARGAVFSNLPPERRVDEAARELEAVYPASRRLLDATASAAWRDERFSGGTYTAYAPGQVERFWRALRRPVGRMVLAGEHTHAYTTYMEGALRSGRAAARHVIRNGGRRA